MSAGGALEVDRWRRPRATRTCTRSASALPVRLQVDAAHQRLVDQQRQGVVPESPLRRRGVDLDAVVEAEHPQRALALPDDRIEGREQGDGLDPPGDAGVARAGRPAASSPRPRPAGAHRCRRGRRSRPWHPPAADGSSRRCRARYRYRARGPRCAPARGSHRASAHRARAPPRAGRARRGRRPARTGARCVATSLPCIQSTSRAVFTSDQPHHGPARTLSSCSNWPDDRGPCSAISRRTKSIISACSTAHLPP